MLLLLCDAFFTADLIAVVLSMSLLFDRRQFSQLSTEQSGVIVIGSSFESFGSSYKLPLGFSIGICSKALVGGWMERNPTALLVVGDEEAVVFAVRGDRLCAVATQFPSTQLPKKRCAIKNQAFEDGVIKVSINSASEEALCR